MGWHNRKMGIKSGVTGGFLLDTFSAEGGYSLRQLKTGITNVCRVRRISDDAEQDFTAAEITQTDLQAFCGGSGIGFIKTFYDQSGNGNDAVAKAEEQYKILQIGVIYNINGIASSFLNTVNGDYVLDSSISFGTAFLVGQVIVKNVINYVMGDPASPGLFVNGTFGGVNGTGGFDGSNIRSLSDEDFDQHSWYWNNRSSDLYAAQDGAAEANIGTFDPININGIVGRPGFNSLRGFFQEVIIFNTDESSNKSAIESDINDYYSIY